MNRHSLFLVLLSLILGIIPTPHARNRGGPTPRRVRRSIHHSVQYDLNSAFRPIRITVVRGVTDGLNATHVRTLDYVVEEAVKRVKSTVNVNRVIGKLRLARPGGCKQVFTSGANREKCASMMEGYRGDFCLDDFKIPDEHQVGLKIYSDSVNPNPFQVIFHEGRGLDETDMVLYVQATSTAKCVSDKVVAYARHCQQDQYQRPIAGYANFCPKEFLESDIQYAIKTAIHELIHTLGFTVDLFRLFQTCEPASCPQTRAIRIQSDLDTHPRLISPTLSRLLKDHLGCHQSYRSDFGALLQSSPSDNSYTSHWDPIFLQGSIMTPAIDKLAYLSLLDPFTLAVLQDTGWYTVNLSNADPYLWGKGKGCDFGLFTDPELTCIQKEPGCHYLHLDKSVCSAIPGAGNLQIADLSCLVPPTFARVGESQRLGEVYSADSRCFMSKIEKKSNKTRSPSSLYPHCFRHRCRNNAVEIEFGGGWFSCPFGKLMTIDSANYSGTIQCPVPGPLCSSFQLDLKSLPHISPPVTTTVLPTAQSEPQRTSPPSSDPQTIGLVFGEIPWQALYESPAHLFMLSSKVDHFLQNFGIPQSSFAKPRVSLYFNDSVVVLVDYTPSSRLSADDLIALLENRISSPDGIVFTIYYAPFVVTKLEHPTAIQFLPPSPFENTEPPSKTPLIAAAVSGAIAAIVILWVIWFCFRIKTPKRPASITSADGVSIPPAGVYPLNSRTLFLSNSEVDAKSSHHPYVHPHHFQHMDMSMGRENPIQVTAV